MPTRIRHAGSGSGRGAEPLCGDYGQVSRPGDTVNCPSCRTVLNHVRRAYPEHAGYTDWRPTTSQLREASKRMAADIYGGADD